MFPTTRSARLLWLLVAIVVCSTTSLFAVSDTIVISQVYGGGGNSGATLKNDFIELFNRGTVPVDVTGWSVQYASSGGSSWTVTNISGTIQPGQYYLVQEAPGAGGTVNLPTPDVIGTPAILMSASGGKVALVMNQTALTGTCPTANVADFVGYGTTTNCSETAPTANLDNTHAALRLGQGYTDTDNNKTDFAIGTPNPRNSGTTTSPLGISGKVSPDNDEAGFTTLVSARITPAQTPPSTGVTVKADLSAIGGSTTQPLYDDGTNGDAKAGDNVYSFAAPIGGSVGAKILTLSASDDQARTNATTVTFTIIGSAEAMAIHDIQGAGLDSPYAGHYVVTSGIVTAVKSNAFFIQAPPDAYDADLNTSEGIYVYAGSVPMADVALGNSVEVRGTVSEYYDLTEIGLKHVTLLSTGNPLPAPVTLTSAELDPHGLITQLERLEGMRVHADSLTTVGPTDGSFSATTGKATTNGEFYAVLSGTPRPYREPGIAVGTPVPAGMPADVPAFDNNPERIRVDTRALAGASALEVTSGTVVNDVTGVLDYTYSSYAILPDTNPVPSGGMTAVGVPGRNPREFTVASFNLLNFSALDLRLSKASRAIRDVLKSPDIVGLEEVNGPAVLQAIADRVNSDAVASGQANPGYAAYMPAACASTCTGFLVRAARVQDLDYAEVGADATFIDPRNGNPMLVNDRPPLVLTAKLLPEAGQPYPVTIILSHLRSLIDVDTVSGTGDFARAKRKAGAEYLANLIAQHQANGENIITLGDYNAYEFNDGYVDVVGTVKGLPAPADQVLLATSDLVEPDMVDLITTMPPTERYTYVENGNAQVLDHILASQTLIDNGFRFFVAHSNADFPASLHNYADRPERVSDHDMPVGYFSFPPLQADLAVSMTAAYATVTSGGTQSYNISVTNSGPDAADTVTVLFTPPTHSTFASVVKPADWTCTAPAPGSTGAISCEMLSFAASGTAQFTINLNVDCATPDNASAIAAVGVTSKTLDDHETNNTASATHNVSNPAPDIAGLAVDHAVLGPPNHQLIPVTLTYTATDNCDASLQPQVSISSNQPLNGTGDGDTAFDWEIVDANHVLLRAERAPDSADGRTYTVTVTVADSAANQSSKSVEVKVPR